MIADTNPALQAVAQLARRGKRPDQAALASNRAACRSRYPVRLTRPVSPARPTWIRVGTPRETTSVWH